MIPTFATLGPAALGAGAMYLLDPEQGPRRRTELCRRYLPREDGSLPPATLGSLCLGAALVALAAAPRSRAWSLPLALMAFGVGALGRRLCEGPPAPLSRPVPPSRHPPEPAAAEELGGSAATSPVGGH